MVITHSKHGKSVAAAVAFAVLAAAALAEVRVGDLFPSMAKAGLTGGSLPDTAGKVVFVDFWASWCAPCKASFPAYSRLADAYSANGLAVVAVSVDTSPADYAAFVARMKPRFTTLNDPAHALVGEVQVPTMPTCYLVDRAGKVRFMHAGYNGQTEKSLRREIEELLAEKAPPP